MSDYIKREDAFNIRNYLKRFGCFGDNGFVEIEGVLIALSKIPSADVAPVRHGRWEAFEDVFMDTCYECSECGLAFYLADGGTPQENQYHYCPNCGAKMDE